MANYVKTVEGFWGRFNPLINFMREKTQMGLAETQFHSSIFGDNSMAWYRLVTTLAYYADIFCPTLAHLHCKHRLQLKSTTTHSVFFPETHFRYNTIIYFKTSDAPGPEDEESVLSFLLSHRDVTEYEMWERGKVYDK